MVLILMVYLTALDSPRRQALGMPVGGELTAGGATPPTRILRQKEMSY